MTDINTYLVHMTIGDLIPLMTEVSKSQIDVYKKEMDKQVQKIVIENTNPKYVYGIKGLAKLFGCGYNTACKLKSSGLLDQAIAQDDRIIVVDAHKAMELFFKKYGLNKYEQTSDSIPHDDKLQGGEIQED